MIMEDGAAFKIPKGSLLGLEMHFVSTGKPETVKVKVGLRFPRKPVQRRVEILQITNTRFAIPPGASAHRVSAVRTLDADVVGIALAAHMHVRGKDMTFVATPPTGTPETLLTVANYNFGWQLPYRWAPGTKTLPKGTKLECVAHFDNSPFNPYNPDATATVKHGLQTQQEMMMGFFFYTRAGEKLGLDIDEKTGRIRR